MCWTVHLEWDCGHRRVLFRSPCGRRVPRTILGRRACPQLQRIERSYDECPACKWRDELEDRALEREKAREACRKRAMELLRDREGQKRAICVERARSGRQRKMRLLARGADVLIDLIATSLDGKARNAAQAGGRTATPRPMLTSSYSAGAQQKPQRQQKQQVTQQLGDDMCGMSLYNIDKRQLLTSMRVVEDETRSKQYQPQQPDNAADGVTGSTESEQQSSSNQFEANDVHYTASVTGPVPDNMSWPSYQVLPPPQPARLRRPLSTVSETDDHEDEDEEYDNVYRGVHRHPAAHTARCGDSSNGAIAVAATQAKTSRETTPAGGKNRALPSSERYTVRLNTANTADRMFSSESDTPSGLQAPPPARSATFSSQPSSHYKTKSSARLEPSRFRAFKPTSDSAVPKQKHPLRTPMRTETMTRERSPRDMRSRSGHRQSSSRGTVHQTSTRAY